MSAVLKTLAQLLRDFFCQWLPTHRRLSPATQASYRDTICLLLAFVARQLQRPPEQLELEHLSPRIVLEFLDYLEKVRHNAVRTRNARLAAIHALMRYAAHQEPSALDLSRRILALPAKRFDRPLLGYLSVAETKAILQAPNPRTRSGRRDRLLFLLLYQTGARISEVLALNRQDIRLHAASAVQFQGKGRKQRQLPLTPAVRTQLKAWLASLPADPLAPLFPNHAGQRLTRFGALRRLKLAQTQAAAQWPSLRKRRLSPHTLRHTTAMHLLQKGVDVASIALWLGHENMETTHQYIEADLELKSKTLARLEPLSRTTPAHYRPPENVLTFLRSLSLGSPGLCEPTLQNPQQTQGSLKKGHIIRKVT
jgi:site-specific recombinase XerD